MWGPIVALLMLSGMPETSARADEGAAAEAAKPKREAKPLSSAAALGSKWGIVTSLLRSRAHNRAVGGAPNSFHLHGRAIDIARRPGVRHADIETAYRKAGFRLIESLDEGDHSHFAFALAGAAAEETQLAAITDTAADHCAAEPSPKRRRRPDRWDGCPGPAEPKPRLRPIEQPAF